MTSKKLNEGLSFEDMRGLVQSVVTIDRHKPKIGTEDETVVMAFDVMYEAPAKELATFIESSNIEHLDVDTSDAPNEEGGYVVFVEFVRDYDLYEKIAGVLKDIDQITSKDNGEWEFIPFKNNGEAVPFNEENFDKYIISSAVKYKMENDPSEPIGEAIHRMIQLSKY